MKRSIIATTAAGLVVLGLGATWFATRQGGQTTDIFAQCRSNAVAGGAGAIGGPFTLTDENGQQVTSAQVIDKPTLLYFGYTYCPDVCPLDSARNAEAVEILRGKGVDVKPVFISVDTARDTPELLREFTDIMDPEMVGLTGTPEEIRKAAQEYRVFFKVDKPGDPYTLIDHSTQSYLVFPELGFVDYFNRDTKPAEMADKIGCYVDAWNKAGKPTSLN